ncbi:ABC transporter ATP-binding protein [Mycoplasmatota bacterium WC44]
MKEEFKFQHLIKYTFNYKKEFIIAVISNILFALVVVGYADMFRVFFDNAQLGLVTGIYENLLLLFSLLCFQGLLHYTSSRYTKILFLKIRRQLQYESIFKVIDGYILETNKLHGGEWMNISLNDTEQIANLGSNNLVRVIHIILKTVIFVIYLFTINITLAIIGMLFSPLMLLIGKLFTERIKIRSRISSEVKGKLTSNVSELFQKAQLFKLNPSNKFLKNKVEHLLKDNFESDLTLHKVRLKYDESSDILGQAGNVIVLSLGAYLIAKGELTTGTLVAFMQIMIQIIWPLVTLSNIYGNYSSVKAKFGRLDLINHLTKDEREIIKKSIEPLIMVDEVSFQIENNIILKNINFEVNHGEWICIVGENGVGKTTLLNLLSGLYKPSSGRIIYNESIFETGQEKLSDVLTYAQQSDGLFMGTIKENIIFDSTNVNEIQLKKLLDESGFQNELPDGINSEIQQSGTNFSGGQKQKISLARLFMSNKDIVFIDEPLSAVDPDSKIKLIKRISEFVKDKTCISIDHNFQFVNYADKILFIDYDGQVLLSTHIKLQSTNDNYRSLVSSVVNSVK